MSKPSVYTMPSGMPFLPSLAAGLTDRLGDKLQDALILLPTRRAVRMLGDAFVDGRGASLLPRIRTLADIDPEEPPFEPGYLTGCVRPVMAPALRRFELARLIAHYHKQVSALPLDPAGMLALADPLLAILDDAALEEVNLSDLEKLKDIELFAARHFQNAATLYKIIQDFWPQYVEEQGQMEPMARRVALLNALTQLWTETPPPHPVVIAGSTGTLKASARLMRCVAKLPGGLIVLPGLDKSLPQEAWIDVGPEHPQHSLRRLISTLGLGREDIPNWPYGQNPKRQDARRRVISESLVPAGATADWPGRIKSLRENYPSGDIFEVALKGLSVIEARSEEEEALTIAVMMRETLETEDKTAALITPDPALARRVKARLRRWHVEVDYSQGEPLEETSIGSFLSGLLALSQDPGSPVDLAFICKHPHTRLGCQPGKARTVWRNLEHSYYRGARPHSHPDDELLSRLWDALSALTRTAKVCSAPEWAQALTRAAERIYHDGENLDGTVLWQGVDGESAAALLIDVIAFGAPLGNMTLAEFTRLLATLLRGRVVRPRYGTHPRLQILGPLEARMLDADRIILGGLNEGVWPAGASAQPFLSRGMRMVMGLSLPERRFGLAAHDFAELAANDEVIFTRAARVDDAPRVASRWLWRLQALTRGAMGKDTRILAPQYPYLDWARKLDHVRPDDVVSATRPAPAPPAHARWPGGRKLSVTQIRTWIRDPYSIYARYVLQLQALSHLDEALGPREYGSAIHKGLERFVIDHPARLPEHGVTLLAKEFEIALVEFGYPEHHLAKYRPRLLRMATDMTAWMATRRAEGWQHVQAETRGDLYLPDLDFSLSSYADLIEKSAEGYAAIDYKTGTPSTAEVVKAGFDPQLPLTALMLERGAFKNVPAGEVSQLIYVQVKATGKGCEPKIITAPDNTKGETADVYSLEALRTLGTLITAFDKDSTPYPSQHRIQYTHDYGEYDDLARRGEWASAGDDGEGYER